jgi:hypothetical protein
MKLFEPVLGRSRCGGEFEVVAELFELADEVDATPIGLVASREVVRAELGVGRLLGEQVPADHQGRVGDRDQSTLSTGAKS